jgi:hypothetical protein
MIGLWLIAMVWVAWAAQIGLGDWLIARKGSCLRWVRAAPTNKALFGLSDRWMLELGDGRAWVRYAHERVALVLRGQHRQVEVPLDAPQAISPSTVVKR